MKNLVTFKKSVYAVSSPGGSKTNPDSEGIITHVEDSFFGAFAVVKWTAGIKAGHEENVMLSSIKTEPRGCGVYYA